MITFVTFHVDLVDSTKESSFAQPPLELAKRAKQTEEYREMLSLMFQSVSVFHKDARKVILTDHQSVFTNLPESVEIHRYEIDTNDVMLSRTKAQVAFLEAHDFKSNVLFLDSDILINDNLETTIDWDKFDIALTIREDPLGMPINGGALFVSNRRPQIAIAFLQSFYQRYIDKYLDESQWWGDQKALVDLLNDTEDPIIIGQRNVGEILVQLIPCDIYNYSPSFKTEIDVYGAGIDRCVIHFKGDRKKFMKSFWDNCIETRLLQSEPQFDLLQRQLSDLQKDRQRLQTELNTEQKEHRALRKKQNALERKYCALKEKNTALKQRHKNLIEHPFRSGFKALKNRCKRWIT